MLADSGWILTHVSGWQADGWGAPVTQVVDDWTYRFYIDAAGQAFQSNESTRKQRVMRWFEGEEQVPVPLARRGVWCEDDEITEEETDVQEPPVRRGQGPKPSSKWDTASRSFCHERNELLRGSTSGNERHRSRSRSSRAAGCRPASSSSAPSRSGQGGDFEAVPYSKSSASTVPNQANEQEKSLIEKFEIEVGEELRKNVREPFEIRREFYKRLLFLWHPDKNTVADEKVARAIFQFITGKKKPIQRKTRRRLLTRLRRN